ncbi:MAG: CPBP family intramembrane metalloprotease [Chlorobiaceae bacterium]|jgi:uncharacterized protein|nr:CPBP family intramembrane metalloprotease [Chlorobiaceae bacterium]NTW63356.1 CPBP family intramembrane metalloprotease [Chlorobiaceae bacterium]
MTVQKPIIAEPFFVRRPSFFLNTLILFGIMMLYQVMGSLLFLKISALDLSLPLSPGDQGRMISLMRIMQAVSQILLLAFPVLLLAKRHAGGEHLFSAETLAFLGIQRKGSLALVLWAVLGVFCLQPLMQTIAELQQLYLWPALGEAGKQVVENQKIMDRMIAALAVMRSLPEAVAVVAVLAVTPAMCEELLFRGYIQENYRQAIDPRAAVILTGFVFAVFHLSAANFVPLTLLGCYIGYVFLKAGTLAVPFAVHLVNNLAALVQLSMGSGTGINVDGASHSGVVGFWWWWLVVAGSMVLFLLCMAKFRAASFSETRQ